MGYDSIQLFGAVFCKPRLLLLIWVQMTPIYMAIG